MIKIDDKALCWCGSGVQYIDCCKSLIEPINFEMSDSEITQNMECENYNEALRYSRANLTKYLIYVKSHTMPLLFSGNPQIKRLIEIDVNALAEILGNMLKVLEKGSLEVDFEKTLRRTKDIFFNDKWHKKADFFYVFYRYIVLGDTKSAIEYIDNNIDIQGIDDVEFMELYYSLCSNRLTFSEKNDFLEKLISKQKLIGKIHYISIMGINYFWIGDIAKCIKLHSDALKLYENNKEKLKGHYDKYVVAQVNSFMGKFAHDENAINRSTELFKELIALDNLSAVGLSETYWLIAMNFIDVEEYDSALEYLSLSQEAMPNNIATIYKAFALMELKNYKRAYEEINTIEFASLSKENKMDYLLVYGRLLIHEINKGKMEFIVSELKKFDSEEGYSLIAKNTVITLLELYNNPLETVENSSKGMRLLESINEFLLLRPSIWGLGIDVNKIIDKMVARIRNRNSR